MSTDRNFTKTRFPELGYRKNAVGIWRIVDVSDPASIGDVGPHYRTKAELLADLGRYATTFGATGAAERPQDPAQADTRLRMELTEARRTLSLLRDDERLTPVNRILIDERRACINRALADSADFAQQGMAPPSEMPQMCPLCATLDLSEIGLWTARSNDPVDSNNTTELTEYQCRNNACGRSFWV